MTDDIIKQFVNKLGNHKCDFFDYAVLMNNIAEKHINIITDDADFISVDEIEIYTVNGHILHS